MLRIINWLELAIDEPRKSTQQDGVEPTEGRLQQGHAEIATG